MSESNRLPPIVVIGAGSWGTALAMHIANAGRDCLLWGHDVAHMRRIAAERCNSDYLPGLPLPEHVGVLLSLDEVPAEASEFLVVVPSHAFRDVVRQLVNHPGLQPRLVAWGTKGIELGSGLLMSDVATAELPADTELAVISGPSFAGEVARGLPTAVSVASPDAGTAQRVAGWLHHDQFRAYTLDDIRGVQLGGALKNVIAIAAGISDGLGFGANARAALITRGLAEIARLGVRAGGRAETFMGLAGLGDLVLTCTDNQSRNRRCGLGLGQGKPLEQVITEIGQEVEGVKSAAAAWSLAQQYATTMPITEQVHNVLYAGLAARDAVQQLLERDPKNEQY